MMRQLAQIGKVHMGYVLLELYSYKLVISSQPVYSLMITLYMVTINLELSL